ncbi:hypothetical protein BV375_02410 [Nostoc sp. 106C]|nr:hypothetical protein BV375_02410 [Nostoc sp. 106C]
MNLKLYEFDVLEAELTWLLSAHRLAFAAACCERLLPNYSLVRQEDGWGDPSILRNALNEVWFFIQGQPISGEQIRQLLKVCSEVVPHADDVSGSQYDVEAQEAASAICFSLEACLDPTPKNIIKVAKSVMNTIDGYLTAMKDIENPNWWDEKSLEEQKKEFALHPLAMREIAKQSEDLQSLKNVDKLDSSFLEWLRTSSDNQGKSLINLP